MKIKKKVILAAVSAVLLASLSCLMSSVSESLEAQNMAERWRSGELKYAQVSVFYPAGKKPYEVNETEMMRNKISDSIKAGAFKSENEDAEIWTDSFNSVTSVSDVYLYDERNGKTENAASQFSVMGVGGDFFEFHPLKLISGNYIYEGELHNGRAVLDEQAAWNMFCSMDVVGMKFMIGGTEFEVAGVVKPEENRAVKKVYPANPMIYIHYDALKDSGLDTSLLCYESVLPDPVTNYARNIILEKFGVDTMDETEDGEDKEKKLDVVIIQNTDRFSFSKLWTGLRNFGMISVHDRSIAYPYWENAARYAGTGMEIMFFFALLLTALILLVIMSSIWKIYTHRKWHLKDFLEDMMYKYTYKKRISDYITPLPDGDNETSGQRYGE